MAEKYYEGPVWVGRDNMIAYDVTSPELKAAVEGNESKETAAPGCFARVDPEFAQKALAGEYQIVIAGTNLGGGGKSIELPVLALQGCGIKIVLAESFARFFYRNAINAGLPIMTCHGILDFAKSGDRLRVELETGIITNLTTGATIQGDLLTPEALEILDAGGYVPYTINRLKK